MLIQSLPALSLLRNDLQAPANALPPIPYEVTRANLLQNMGMTIATRPAASGCRARGLDTLGEEEEVGDHLLNSTQDSRRGRL